MSGKQDEGLGWRIRAKRLCLAMALALPVMGLSLTLQFDAKAIDFSTAQVGFDLPIKLPIPAPSEIDPCKINPDLCSEQK